MPEINGHEITEGDKIFVEGRIARVVRYSPVGEADQLVYEVLDGNSINRVTVHVSNTRFEYLPGGELTLNGEDLDSAEALWIHDPKMESDDSTRTVANEDGASNDQFTTLDDQQ